MPPPVPNKNIAHWVENGKGREVILVEKKKIGRPTSDPKNHELKIRMSDKYMEKLEYCQKMTGMTRVDVIRSGIDKVYLELIKK